jgi:hypothetical protein
MALAQQGKVIDEKVLDNYVNRGTHSLTRIRKAKHIFPLLELPIPTIDNITEIENRFIRLLRTVQRKNTLCFRYGDLCSLDTIQVEVAPEKKGYHVH